MDLETLEMLRRVARHLEGDEEDIEDLLFDVQCAIAKAEAERQE